jgi:serine/threonine protein kinase
MRDQVNATSTREMKGDRITTGIVYAHLNEQTLQNSESNAAATPAMVVEDDSPNNWEVVEDDSPKPEEIDLQGAWTDAFSFTDSELRQLPDDLQKTGATLTDLLTNRDKLKKIVSHWFDKKEAAEEGIDIVGLQKLQEYLARKLGLANEVFIHTEEEFESFDFNGDGVLSVNEVYKLVKYNLAEYRKQLGHHEANVPFQQATDFTFIRELGQGAYGQARLAQDERGQEVCVKCFAKDKMTASAAEDLCHEFQALNLLQCERVAGASKMFQDASMYYMVGEVYYGGDLSTLREHALDDGVDLTEDWWRHVFRQILEGIAFMHNQAVIHCDIKEPNVMVKTTDYFQPQVVIIDLGVAVSSAKQDNGMPHGTPGYVPPETLETLKWFPKGDLFSTGVVMIQMLIDKVQIGIFQEGCTNVQEIFVATRKREPPFHLMPPQFPLLKALVEKLLQKRRQHRPTAVQALRDPWLDGCGEGDADEDWCDSPSRKALRPKNKFATKGVSAADMARILAECSESDTHDDDDDDDDAK